MLHGDLQRGVALAAARGAIGAALEEQTDQREVAVERRFVKWGVAGRRAPAVNRTSARDQEPDDVRAALGARPGGGGIDRQVGFGIPRDAAHIGTGVEERLGGLAMAEERRQVEGWPAVVGPLPHDPGILAELPANVLDQPEGTG